MFRVKICGVTSAGDAAAAVAAGADAIGINFFAASPRYCSADVARAVAQSIPAGVCKVGVFVNASAAEIRRAVETLGLDLVQLHGDESPALLHDLRGVGVIRAFRIGGDYVPAADYLQICQTRACLPRMVLLDAARGGAYGGTGETLDWQLLHSNRRSLAGLPLVLAGGLKPSNVAAAITAVRPWAVDVASGVETSPGKKSAQLIGEFVNAAKAAFAEIHRRR